MRACGRVCSAALAAAAGAPEPGCALAPPPARRRAALGALGTPASGPISCRRAFRPPPPRVYQGWLLPEAPPAAEGAAGPEAPPPGAPSADALARAILRESGAPRPLAVAVKVMEAVDMSAFLREADLLARLAGGPAVVALHGACVADQQLIVVMELMEVGRAGGVPWELG